jgi:hypothetical protein
MAGIGALVVGEQFEREYGCEPADWHRWMPSATHGHAFAREGDAGYRIQIGSGNLRMHWELLPHRRIALMTLPRMQVLFRFEGVEPEARQVFMRGFDMRTQRGGG